MPKVVETQRASKQSLASTPERRLTRSRTGSLKTPDKVALASPRKTETRRTPRKLSFGQKSEELRRSTQSLPCVGESEDDRMSTASEPVVTRRKSTRLSQSKADTDTESIADSQADDQLSPIIEEKPSRRLREEKVNGPALQPFVVCSPLHLSKKFTHDSPSSQSSKSDYSYSPSKSQNSEHKKESTSPSKEISEKRERPSTRSSSSEKTKSSPEVDSKERNNKSPRVTRSSPEGRSKVESSKSPVLARATSDSSKENSPNQQVKTSQSPAESKKLKEKVRSSNSKNYDSGSADFELGSDDEPLAYKIIKYGSPQKSVLASKENGASDGKILTRSMSPTKNKKQLDNEPAKTPNKIASPDQASFRSPDSLEGAEETKATKKLSLSSSKTKKLKSPDSSEDATEKHTEHPTSNTGKDDVTLEVLDSDDDSKVDNTSKSPNQNKVEPTLEKASPLAKASEKEESLSTKSPESSASVSNSDSTAMPSNDPEIPTSSVDNDSNNLSLSQTDNFLSTSPPKKPDEDNKVKTKTSTGGDILTSELKNSSSPESSHEVPNQSAHKISDSEKKKNIPFNLKKAQEPEKESSKSVSLVEVSSDSEETVSHNEKPASAKKTPSKSVSASNSSSNQGEECRKIQSSAEKSVATEKSLKKVSLEGVIDGETESSDDESKITKETPRKSFSVRDFIDDEAEEGKETESSDDERKITKETSRKSFSVRDFIDDEAEEGKETESSDDERKITKETSRKSFSVRDFIDDEAEEGKETESSDDESEEEDLGSKKRFSLKVFVDDKEEREETASSEDETKVTKATARKSISVKDFIDDEAEEGEETESSDEETEVSKKTALKKLSLKDFIDDEAEEGEETESSDEEAQESKKTSRKSLSLRNFFNDKAEETESSEDETKTSPDKIISVSDITNDEVEGIPNESSEEEYEEPNITKKASRKSSTTNNFIDEPEKVEDPLSTQIEDNKKKSSEASSAEKKRKRAFSFEEVEEIKVINEPVKRKIENDSSKPSKKRKGSIDIFNESLRLNTMFQESDSEDLNLAINESSTCSNSSELKPSEPNEKSVIVKEDGVKTLKASQPQFQVSEETTSPDSTVKSKADSGFQVKDQSPEFITSRDKPIGAQWKIQPLSKTPLTGSSEPSSFVVQDQSWCIRKLKPRHTRINSTHVDLTSLTKFTFLSELDFNTIKEIKLANGWTQEVDPAFTERPAKKIRTDVNPSAQTVLNEQSQNVLAAAFLTNLPEGTNAVKLVQAFSKVSISDVDNVDLSACPSHLFKRNKGYGTVTFESEKSLIKAVSTVKIKLNGVLIQVHPHKSFVPKSEEAVQWFLSYQKNRIASLENQVRQLKEQLTGKKSVNKFGSFGNQ